MTGSCLEGVEWYVDHQAEGRSEPGIAHSYVGCLATALQHAYGDLDPVWLMGSSAFAFRIYVNEVFCPSAMSMFDFNALLPEAVEQVGYQCHHVSRMWHETDQQDARRDEAHAAIVDGIQRGVPAVAWDIADCEWGLVVGLDERARKYRTVTHGGQPSSLPFDRLGNNGIDILAVTVLGAPNGRTRDEVVRNALAAAVAHAEQREPMDRPQYQDGLPAFDLWALLYDRWAMLVEAGKAHNIPASVLNHVAYYAKHWYGARCYARDYLRTIAAENTGLRGAAAAFARVASHLKPVWDHASKTSNLTADVLRPLSAEIRYAKAAEAEAIEHIREHLPERGLS